MKNITYKIKIEDYLKVLRARRSFIVVSFLPLFLFFVFAFFIEEKKLFMFAKYGLLPYLVCIYVVSFRMLMCTCPWCLQSFFYKHYGVLTSGSIGFFSKKCVHCGEPKNGMNVLNEAHPHDDNESN